VDEATIISEYSLEQAIEDGVLVEVFKDRWQQLSGGKPIVATSHVFGEVSLAAFLELWNTWVAQHTHDRNERADIFVTELNGKKVWVIEDTQAITFLYPEDY